MIQDDLDYDSLGQDSQLTINICEHDLAPIITCLKYQMGVMRSHVMGYGPTDQQIFITE